MDKVEQIAEDFIRYFRDSWPYDFDEPLRYLAEDCYYQGVVPVTDPISGRAAIKAKLQAMRDLYPEQRHDMKASAAKGRYVFQERTDWALIAGRWVEIPLVAVFEVEGDSIVAWREYLDSGHVAQQSDVDLQGLQASMSTPTT